MKKETKVYVLIKEHIYEFSEVLAVSLNKNVLSEKLKELEKENTYSDIEFFIEEHNLI